MQRPRVHTPATLRAGTTHVLPEDSAAHVIRVLRLAAGDPIILFNGTGVDYEAVLRTVARGSVTADVGHGRAVDRESPLAITLLQGISRGARMDTVMQKATELGVHAIHPLLTERSVVRLEGERAAARVAHWQRIAISACEQCGRSVIPEIRPPSPLAAALAGLDPDAVRLALDPQAGGNMESLIAGRRRVVLAVGPEGGFSESENRMLAAGGFHGLCLGPRILRTETAPLAALAILQFAAGDLDGNPGGN